MESEATPSKSRTVPVIDTKADADSASHSSSTSLPGGEYQVFLSFSDPDTRYGFTDYLYNSLTQNGVRTFRGEIDRGEEINKIINKAIRESRISIPIFSRNYASCKRCLMELELMVESQQLILPIFYDVSPSEVKHQSGSYGKAFKEHEKSGLGSETILKWKNALKKVGNLAGWYLKRDADGNAGQLITEKIVPAVLSELFKFMYETRNLVGMDHHENAMMNLLQRTSDDVQIVGIHGMVGIGKTTVAKFIYNKLLKDFDCCSFLANVQMEQELHGTLVSLQNQLLSDTLNWSPGIANVDIGITTIKQRLRNKKVLIVLDDVNSISQFHCLVGEPGCFGKGSKIIVSTKNKGVLNDLEVEWTYEIPIMNAVQSLQLFSKHAFDKEFPPEEYVRISRKIASFAGGLPLALKTVGSSLFGVKDLEKWEAASKRFEDMQNDDVDYEALIDTEADAGGKYKVFLSFSGPDTRYGFTDYLYNSLTKNGVRTFRDHIDLRRGEQINKAIRESRISIPIFSRNYASSKRCLMELELMLEFQQLILPIFYDVSPSEVKHQTGSYGKAFKEHEKSGLGSETIVKWKNALREVGNITGWCWDLKRDADGNEGQLITEEIVPAVLSMLFKFMDVTRNLVGMDHHENEMKNLLQSASDDVQIVGIHGMNGIGKTTVAKFIYNKLLEEDFDCCSFVADVQMEQERHGTLVCLQNQLLSDTLNWRPGIANVDSGITIIKQKFRYKKALIVLDDVNSISQFHCLVGEPGCFGNGSKIIVTTKNKGVLNALKVEWTYEIPIMNDVQSLQLFCKHAFHMDFPPDEYDRISRKIASFAGGLPLALECVGSSLFGVKDLEKWEVASKRFEEMSKHDVRKKLRVDYDALNSMQQQIFLDIACLFVGMDKTTLFYMWDDCGYYPKIEFNDLYLKSLVKVGDANELWMHNQLIALGKKIVNDENFLGNRSRLWKHEEALSLLKKRMGTEQVEALSLCFKLESEEKPPCFGSEQFTRLVNLRYLRVDGADLVGDFKRVLLSLRWLSWRGCPPDFKPTNFHMKNLVILDLSKSDITEEWGGWKQIQMAKKLKVLQVSNCALTRTPNFSSDTPLEILILRGCGKLENIDPSIGNLKNLKKLDLSYTDIRKLPDEIWMLEMLEVMDFTNCSMLDADIPSKMGRFLSLRSLSFYRSRIRSLPANISGLTQLQTLNIGGCTELHPQPDLPSSLRILNVGYIPNLTSLVNVQELELFRCHNLKGMLGDIGKLSKLEKLRLRHTKIGSLPEDIGLLSQLKALDLKFCDHLQCIPVLPSSLVDLSLAYCRSLVTLPDLSNLKILTSLYINDCPELPSKNLLDLSSLKKLEILYIRNCSRLDKIRGLEGLESLKFLDLIGYENENLREIEGLGALKSLEVLNLSCWKNLCWIEIVGIKSLEVLNVSSNEKLREIMGLEDLNFLKVLDMSGCGNLREIAGLQGLKSLEELNVSRCMELHMIEGLEDLKFLKVLDMSGCENLRKIAGLQGLKSLEELNVSHCMELHMIEDLEDLKFLKVLNMSGCESLRWIAGLQGLKYLEELNMSRCIKVHTIKGLEDLRSLKILNMSSCESLNEIADLQGLKSLEELNVSCCIKLGMIKGLEDLKSLKVLDVSGCKNLYLTAGLQALKSLEKLNVSRCMKFRMFKGLEDLRSLKILDMSSCNSLYEIARLHGLKSLEVLNVSGCMTLRTIEGLQDLKSLEVLDVSGCENLCEIEGLQALKSLKVLDVSGCKNFCEIEGLPALKSLKELNVSGCENLHDIEGLQDLKSLEVLNVTGCENLRGIEGLEALKSLKVLRKIEGLEALKSLKY
ncbi:disease resistance protein L6-like [Cornus florida]|uniref:disease resistance protein L6-like n=1 Tax=Cornus florida TaxID=4283 RepID=UPI00289DB844|nr:disease resistance protein L6-like [Cornus florida]